MISFEESTLIIQNETDIIKARKIARELAKEIGFGVTDITRIITAVSELARNVVNYANHGKMKSNRINSSINSKDGIEFIFNDEGPGIPNIELALKEGYSTGNGLGMGLPGVKRLMDEMEVSSEIGKGTLVIIRKWLR